MEQQYEPGTAAALWESAPIPQPSTKFDNRAYLMAAHHGWADALNLPITGLTRVEEQALPYEYSAEYQATTRAVRKE
ncbi:MAG: hypothetical protein MUP76_03600 [Acidimicrobiia bacterium]|nr:hypothetical protein [Acidimicrobiia bacterium]